MVDVVTSTFGILYNDVLWLFDVSAVTPSSFILVLFMNIFATVLLQENVENVHKLWSTFSVWPVGCTDFCDVL
jgi:hypothetical protein